MNERDQKASKDENGSSDRLVESLLARLSGMTLAERVSSWWMFDGSFLVSALKQSTKHSPSYLEALATASGDLAFEAGGFARVSKEFVDALGNFSRQSPAGYQLAKRICILNLVLGKLQSELQPLAALIIAGELKEPRPGSGQTSKNWHRDLLLVRGIASTAKFNITATRNEASVGVSGCDLVIEAFKKAGRRDTPTYETAKKIWQRRKKLLADHEEIDFLVYRQSVER